MHLAATPYICVAETLPAPGPVDARIRVARYSPDDVIRLQAFVGYQLEIEFEPGEVVMGQGAGDLEGIALASFANHLFLKPKAADVGTNLTISTNRRTYRFDYMVAVGPPDPLRHEVMYVVRFTYPPVPAAKTVSAADRIERELSAATERRPRNLDYWFCGDPAVRPTAAFDDGVQTRLSFGSNRELPALFVRNDDGSESLLNFSIEAGDVIVHRVARRFILRRGKLTGCILNQAFRGSGERLESGTVATDVLRTRTEPTP
jgi:type IV secretion system protein VirB9